MADSTRKLTVTSCEEIRSGTTNGRDWTIYDVAAVDEAGDPVDKELRAFDPLPIGELLEYDVTRKDHPKYGPSFTLTRPGIKPTGDGGKSQSPGARLGPKVDELRNEVGDLARRVADLERRLESGGSAAAAAHPDDDIPF